MPNTKFYRGKGIGLTSKDASDALFIPATRKLYCLADAATAAGCSIDTLLDHGAAGGLPILAQVPDNVRVYATNKHLLDASDPTTGLMRRMHQSYVLAHGMRPRAMQDISLLVLGRRECGLVTSHGEAYQAEFKMGVCIDDDHDLILVNPPAVGSDRNALDKFFGLFACYPSNQVPPFTGVSTGLAPIKLRLSMDLLRVREEDLAKLNLISASCASTFDNGFRVKKYMPRQLVQLDQGAWRFWDCSQPGWSEPTNAEVKSWFIDECGFPSKVAAGAAQILRQSYRNWNQEEYDQKKADVTVDAPERKSSTASGVINMFDAVVYVAGFWKGADLGTEGREGRRQTYPDRD
jgi:hypothetical protein